MAPVKTHNFGDLLRYFKYNMGAGLMIATLERMVVDAREDMQGNSLGTAVKVISLGIMILLACLGVYIVIQNPALAGGGAAAPTQSPNLYG